MGREFQHGPDHLPGLKLVLILKSDEFRGRSEHLRSRQDISILETDIRVLRLEDRISADEAA